MTTSFIIINKDISNIVWKIKSHIVQIQVQYKLAKVIKCKFLFLNKYTETLNA